MNSFFDWWQHLPQHIDPVFFQLGGLQIRYYGICFVSAIVITYLVVLYRIKKEDSILTQSDLDILIVWLVFGVILGGRLGYVLFYDLSYFIHHPFQIFLPFDSGFNFIGLRGMSYHGGLFGAFLAILFFGLHYQFSFWKLVDFIVPAVPLGYTLGRIGNFLNDELFGRVTQSSWGMYFNSDASGQLRYPSQLLEALFEGLILFVLLWSIRNKNYFNGFVSGVYLIGYGLFRFFIEYTREPDAHLGFVVASFSMGQILCLFMIFIGSTIMTVNFYFNNNQRGKLAE